MAEKITLRTAVDVYTTPVQDATYGLNRIYINAEAQAYLFFNLPSMPVGAQILSATLQMYAGSLSTAAVGPNLVTNPGFEVNTTGWAVSGAGATITRDTAVFDTGVASARLNSTVIDSGINTTVSIPAIGSKQYTANVRVRGTGSALVIIEQIAPSTVTVVTSATVTVTGAFQTITVSGTTPVGSTSLRIHVRQKTTAAQTLYVDNVTVQEAFPTVTISTVTSAYDANRLTWLTRPTESAVVDTENTPTSAATGLWEFDVQPELAAAVAAGSWYGLTVESNGDANDYFWGSNSASPMQLVVTWTAPPATPTSLMPTGSQIVNSNKPVVSWNAGTAAGGERPYSFNVQVATNVNMVTGLWDSGEVLSLNNLLDLSTTAFPAITSGQTRYWRVRTKNTSMIWSAWSAVSQFSYTDPGTATITVPAAVTTTPVPNMTWTFTGSGAQQAFQVIVKNLGAVILGTSGQVMYDSGIIYSATLAHQLPQGIWKYNGDQMSIELRVWDTNDRIGLPGAPTYSVATKTVTFTPSGLAGPTQLQVNPYGVGYPHQNVKWEYTASIVGVNFAVVRYRYPGDPEPNVTWVTPAATAVVGQPNWYQYPDGFVGGRTDATWLVRASNNIVMSTAEISVTKKIDNIMPWLVSTSDMNKRLAMVNYTVDPGLSEVSDIVSPLNGPPSLVSQVLKGFIGSASGRLANDTVSGLSARQMKENFMWMRKNPHVYFMWADEAIECYIYECKYTSIPTADGSTDYGITFGFIETLRGR